MEAIIKQAKLGGTVKAIASKSLAQRLLICSTLSEAPTFIECADSSADIEATVGCLNALGARIERNGEGYAVSSLQFDKVNKGAVLDCGESGATLRFMLPVACALAADVSFTAGGRLPQRPLSPLYEELIAHGCSLSKQGQMPLNCEGKLTSGKYQLAGDVSSQFVSGLLLALPLLDSDSEIILNGKIESQPYIDLTVSALNLFGINIEIKENIYFVRCRQKYCSPGKVVVEGDWSNAAFWLCAAALGDMPITCINIKKDSLQGDKAVAELLKMFGANVSFTGNTVTVSGGKLQAIEIDARNIPDLVPALSVVACAAQGKTVIYNAGRLRVKESDRLKSVADTLTKLGAVIYETDDGLVIEGKRELQGGTVSCNGDHRIAMMASIAAVIAKQTVVIEGAEAVKKSYPGFFKDFGLLGGVVELK